MRYYAATLRDLIKAGISRERVLPLFSQILDGVEAAHLKNVWHRDLKPENILYDQTTESYLVADFGIAHFGEEELYTLVETRAHDRLANFQYAAPEQRARGRKVDNRADIYALGLILNELFTGEVPQGAGFKRIGDVSPEYSYLDDLIHEMIQQDPENRTASIQAIKLQVIGRGKEFVRLQELNKLKTTVIPETTIDDPIIHRPVELVGIDYSAGMLRLKLNQAPGVAWIRTFSGMGYTAAISGKEPSRFSFLQDEAEIPVNTQDAQFVVNHFKNYLREANRLYVTGIENARRHQIEQRNRELQESLKRAEEERKTRETILKTIKF